MDIILHVDKILHKETENLYSHLSDFEKGYINLDQIVIDLINHKIEDNEKKNNTNVNHLFKVNEDYDKSDICSKEDCLKLIENGTITSVYDNNDKEIVLLLLNVFWDDNPNGIITFS